MISPNVALVAWIPIVLLMFSLWPARRAVFYAVIGGMLFLPELATIKIPGLAYSKHAAIAIATMLGILLFDGNRLTQFRFRWYDLFWAALCTTPFFTSLENGLGPKDGVIECITMAMFWGIPYFIGRLYLTDIHALREAAVAVLVGGLVYVPLCLMEVVLSPQLHNWVYGRHQHSFAQTLRFGGYRPMVFMQHGLAVGLFMAAASLMGIWLWWCASVRTVLGLPIAWATAAVLLATLLCKSSGSVALMLIALAVLAGVYYFRSALPLLLLIAIPPVYMVTRAAGLFDGKVLVAAVAAVVNEDRAKSLKFRMDAEDVLSKKALQKPIFGWGGWDRSRAPNASGYGMAVTDGMWVIAMGKRGLVGVIGLYAAFLIGPLLLRKRYDPKLWTHPAVAPAVVVAVVVMVHMIDSIPNGMPNSIYYFLGGGLAGLAAYPRAATATTTVVATPARRRFGRPARGPQAVAAAPQSPAARKPTPAVGGR